MSHVTEPIFILSARAIKINIYYRSSVSNSYLYKKFEYQTRKYNNSNFLESSKKEPLIEKSPGNSSSNSESKTHEPPESVHSILTKSSLELKKIKSRMKKDITAKEKLLIRLQQKKQAIKEIMKRQLIMKKLKAAIKKEGKAINEFEKAQDSKVKEDLEIRLLKNMLKEKNMAETNKQKAEILKTKEIKQREAIKLKKEMQKIIKIKVAEIKKQNIERLQKNKDVERKETQINARIHNFDCVIKPPTFSKVTSYHIYLKEMMIKVKDNLPTRTLELHRRIIIELSKQWNIMSEEGKKPYKDKADQLNIKRKEELESWWDTVDKDLVALENQRRKNLNASGKREGKYRLPKLTDPRTPKKPLNPYFIFRSEVEALYKSESFEGSKQFTRQVALKWRQLSENDKSVYIEKYREASRNFFEQKEKLQKIYDSKKTSLTKPNHR